jgi:hypothetical protein
MSKERELTGNEEGYFNKGYERGSLGGSHGAPVFGDWNTPSETEKEARERGYEAGKIEYEKSKK